MGLSMVPHTQKVIELGLEHHAFGRGKPFISSNMPHFFLGSLPFVPV